MLSNRFVFGYGSYVACSYMISIAELLQAEGYLVREIYGGDYGYEELNVESGISFSELGFDKQQIFLEQLSDNTIVIYFEEDIDITRAFDMFKEIRDKVGL